MHSTPIAWSLRRTFPTPVIFLGTFTYRTYTLPTRYIFLRYKTGRSDRIRTCGLMLLVPKMGFEPTLHCKMYAT